MKSIKSKILVFLSFLFSIFFVGSAFSAYIFSEKTNLHTDKAEGLMDDILNNYELDANSYTVYFFPSSKWANYMKDHPKSASTSLDDYLADCKTNYNYKDQQFGYFPDDEDPYGYKVRYADTCISTDTFDQMSVPLTTAKDSEGYYVRFSGWTANFANAIEYGYMSQGTFDYISSYDELSSVVAGQYIYNNASIDIPKNTLFVFPVLTSGKEYDKNKTYNCHNEHAVRIHDRKALNIVNVHGDADMYFDRELYFSQEGTGDSAFYFYNNLKVRENEMLYLDFAFGGDWYNFKNSYTGSWDWYSNTQNTQNSEKWEGESYDAEGTEKYKLNPLFDTRTGGFKLGDCAVNEPGVYNIYAYICESGSENNSPDAFKNKQLSNSPLVWFEDSSNQTNSTKVAINNSKHTWSYIYNIYVKIEKITEFGLSGGRTKSLQYVDTLQMNVMPRTNASTSRYYVLNNVFLEGENINETITATNKNDGSFYSYPSSISTLLMNDGSPVELGKLTASSNQLVEFQKDYKKVYGNDTIYDFTKIYEQTSVHYSPYSIVPDSDVTTLFENTTKNIFFRPKKSGFYTVVAKITIVPKPTGVGYSYNLDFDKKSEIALCLGAQIHANVFLYNKGDTISRTVGGKFIDTNGNWYAKAISSYDATTGKIEYLPYGESLTYDTLFLLKDGTTKKLREILGVSGTTAANHLTNHLTGREFKFDSAGKSIQLRRNYAFYIMPGAWKEDELGKNK